MTFTEALQKLHIEDYRDRIFNSNSHGELFHLQEYFILAEHVTDGDAFRRWFVEVVGYAEANWKRPESVFQHISKLL